MRVHYIFVCVRVTDKKKKKLCKRTAPSNQKRIRAYINALVTNPICIINPFFARLRIMYSKIIHLFRNKKSEEKKKKVERILSLTQARWFFFWHSSGIPDLWIWHGNWPLFSFVYFSFTRSNRLRGCSHFSCDDFAVAVALAFLMGNT